MIGKAERGPVAIEAIRKHKAAYLMAVGGAAYLVAKAIRKSRVRRLRRSRHGSDLRIRGEGHAGDRGGRCERHLGAQDRAGRVVEEDRRAEDPGHRGLSAGTRWRRGLGRVRRRPDLRRVHDQGAARAARAARRARPDAGRVRASSPPRSTSSACWSACSSACCATASATSALALAGLALMASRGLLGAAAWDFAIAARLALSSKASASSCSPSPVRR